MNRLAILLSGLAISALPCTSALASELTFSFNNGSFSGSGDLTYTTTSTAGTFLVTAGTGSVLYNGATYAINLLPVNNFAGNDNLFFNPPVVGGKFDFNGVGFSLLNSPNYALSLFSAPPAGAQGNPPANVDFELLGVNGGQQLGGGQQQSPITVTLIPTGGGGGGAVTPEPGSLALLGTGALGAFGVLRRKLAV